MGSHPLSSQQIWWKQDASHWDRNDQRQEQSEPLDLQQLRLYWNPEIFNYLPLHLLLHVCLFTQPNLGNHLLHDSESRENSI